MTATKGKKRQTLAELRSLQKIAGAVIMRPLAPNWRTQRKWTDRRDIRKVVSQFIKPNDRLTALERIEIYNKQYWFRLIDCMYDDFPGIHAVLGRLKFNKLLVAYLEKHPSKSFTLRNLGSGLPDFIAKHRKMFGSKFDMVYDMSRFEWAQAVAFDGPSLRPLKQNDILGVDVKKLKLRLQPYIVLLDLKFPIDDFKLQLNQDRVRGDASNAVDEADEPHASKRRRAPLPKRKRTLVAVHRHDNSLYYKRLEEDEFKSLLALQAGKTLAKAISSSYAWPPDPRRINAAFETWASLGWFCEYRSDRLTTG